MEDLGNINITIREGAGGKGASGTVGGGPKGKEPPSAAEVAEAVKTGETEQERIRKRAAEPVPPIAMFERFNRVVGRQQVGAELMDFMRRPSFANATGLIREGSATRGMLEGLGKTGLRLGSAFLAVGAVAAGVTLAIKGMQKAVEHVSKRIEETWRYSMEQAGAMAEQQVMRIAMLAREAAENGARYAAVIRAQTRLEQERARLNTEIGKITSGMAEDLYRSLTLLMREINGAIAETKGIRDVISEVVGYVPAVALVRGISAGVSDIEGSGLTVIQLLRLEMLRFFGMEEAANNLQNEYMNEIMKNTRKDVMAEANEWFQADIVHLTGRRF